MPLLSSSVMDPSSPGEMHLLEGTAKPSRYARGVGERERDRGLDKEARA